MAVPVADTAYEQRNGDFVFGVWSGTGEVLWSNGTVGSGIDDANCLDKIVPNANSTLAGKKVKFGAGNTAEYYGIVLRCYSRQLFGAGVAPVSFVLIQLLNSPVKVEVLANAVSVVN